MKLIGKVLNREMCEEMQLVFLYRLLYKKRLDLDTETVYINIYICRVITF